MKKNVLSSLRKTANYHTRRGVAIHGNFEKVFTDDVQQKLKNRVQLIFTSPPFPLNRKKKYGNLTGDDYIQWLASFAQTFNKILAPSGSLVLELGNAWESGKPVMSTLALEALLELKKKGGFHLCQQFICHNPARLPSPAQWVNVERIRVKDSYTHVWWLSKTDRPKADNRKVLREYSSSMLKLLESKKYNAGKRPSEFVIGAKSFLKNNGGAIPSNVLTISNTRSNDPYLSYCKKQGADLHPARMPSELAEFFIRFLTTPKNLVLDPFAGSNTTGSVAESLKRRWISVEANSDYLRGSLGRFEDCEDLVANGRGKSLSRAS